MNILLITRQMPLYIHSGSNYIFNLFKSLKGKADSRILVCIGAESIPDNSFLLEFFDKIIQVPEKKENRILKRIERVFLFLGNLFRPENHPIFSSNELRVQKKMDEIIKDNKIDLICVLWLRNYCFIDTVKHNCVLFIATDSHSLYFKRNVGIENKFIFKTVLWFLYQRELFREKRALKFAKNITVVSRHDGDWLKKISGKSPRVIPVGLDCEVFNPKNISENSMDSNYILFTGKMDYKPNSSAAEFFLKHIFPLILQKLPYTHFLIAGDCGTGVTSLEALSKQFKTVTLTGYVEDLKPYFLSAAVFVAPMINGSGIKNKILEAMAMEKAIVATPLAVDAINVKNEHDVMICGDTTDFAEKVILLLTNEKRRKELGRNARKTVIEQYSLNRVTDTYMELFCNILNNSG